MDKTLSILSDVVSGIADGAVRMIGGFGGSVAPIELIHALIDRFYEVIVKKIGQVTYNS